MYSIVTGATTDDCNHISKVNHDMCVSCSVSLNKRLDSCTEATLLWGANEILRLATGKRWANVVIEIYMTWLVTIQLNSDRHPVTRQSCCFWNNLIRADPSEPSCHCEQTQISISEVSCLWRENIPFGLWWPLSAAKKKKKAYEHIKHWARASVSSEY